MNFDQSFYGFMDKVKQPFNHKVTTTTDDDENENRREDNRNLPSSRTPRQDKSDFRRKLTLMMRR